MPTPAYPREWSVSPETLIDEVLLTIPWGRGRRRRYKADRQNMLDAWYPVGLDFLNVVAREPTQPWPAEAVGEVPYGAVLMTRSPSGSYGETAPTTNPYHEPPYAGLLGVSNGTLRRGLQRRATERSLPHVLVHEMGHILGLGHTSDPDSVMNTATNNAAPNLADLQALSGPDTGLPDPGDPGYRAPRPRARSRRKRG